MPRPSRSSKTPWERGRGGAASRRAATAAGAGPRGPHAGTGAGGDARAPRGPWLLAAAVIGALAVIAFLGFRRGSPRPVVAVAPPAPAVALPPAEQSLRETVARLPQDPDAHRALARYLLEQHRPFEALWHFMAGQDLDPADTGDSIDAARALGQAGFPARAESVLRARLARASTDLDARLALAEIDLGTARPQAALAALAGAAAAVATSAPAQLLLGDARALSGDAEGARTAYRRAVALEPESAAAHDRLGRLALARAAWPEAKQEFAAARERDPAEPAYGYRLGQAYWEAGQRAEAEQLWQGLAGSSPGCAPALLALGKAYLNRGEAGAAAQPLVAAVNADPASSEAQFALADVMTRLGKPASAAYQHGIYYLQTDRPHRAAAAFQRMMTLAPDRAEGPLRLSLAYIQMKRLDLAAAAAERALRQHPHDPQLLAQLGALHILGRNRPKSEQLCREWLKYDPNAAEPYRLLARVAREEQRLPEALRLGEQALARDPQNALVDADLAKTLEALGGAPNIQRAAGLARQAVALNPKEADHWLELGTLLRSEGDLPGSTDALLRVLDLDPTALPACTGLAQIAGQEKRPASARLFAALATELQKNQRARDMLWEAVYRQPADATARARLAQALVAAGNLRRARYQLEELAALRPADSAARRELALVRSLYDLRSP